MVSRSLDRPIAAGACLALSLAAAAPAAAHPHMFIEGGVDFHFDDAGRLTHLQVTWVHDWFFSMFLLEDLGVVERPDGTLSESDAAIIAAAEADWMPGWDGDLALWPVEGRGRLGLSGPIATEAALEDGHLVIRFLRRLAEPFRPGAATLVKMYDPTYYIAYRVTETPRIHGAGGAGCTVALDPFDPDRVSGALRAKLAALAREEIPEQEDVGRLFADAIRISCAPRD